MRPAGDVEVVVATAIGRRGRLALAVAVLASSAACETPDPAEPEQDAEVADAAPEPTPQGVLVEVVLPPRDALHAEVLDDIASDVQLVATMTRADVREIRSVVPDRDVFVADLVHHLAATRADLTCALTTGASGATREAHADSPQKRFCAVVTSDIGAEEREGLDVVVLRTAELGYLVGTAASVAAGAVGSDTDADADAAADADAVAYFLAPHDLERGRFADGLRAALGDHPVVDRDPDEDVLDEAVRVVEEGASVVVVGAHPQAREIAETAIEAGAWVMVPEAIADGLDSSRVVMTWRILFDRVLRGPVDRLLSRDEPAPLHLGLAEGVFVTDVGPDAPLGVNATVGRIRTEIVDGELDPLDVS